MQAPKILLCSSVFSMFNDENNNRKDNKDKNLHLCKYKYVLYKRRRSLRDIKRYDNECKYRY